MKRSPFSEQQIAFILQQAEEVGGVVSLRSCSRSYTTRRDTIPGQARP